MGLTYHEASEKYKNDKKNLVDGYKETPYKKKKVKKNKRSDHKHEYIPAVYRLEGRPYQTCGYHCKKCGRIEDLFFYFWFHNEEQIENFKKENPGWVEIILPSDWNYFKNKNIPV